MWCMRLHSFGRQMLTFVDCTSIRSIMTMMMITKSEPDGKHFSVFPEVGSLGGRMDGEIQMRRQD